MACFLNFCNETDQYLYSFYLRKATADARDCIISILNRLLPRLHEAFPKANLLIRLDGGFARTEFLITSMSKGWTMWSE